jgi:signal transduction histidine kinase
MKGRGRRRQLLLFLTALILPSLAVIGFGLGMIVQERELSRQRASEARRQAISAIANEILTRLERIKSQELSANPDIDARPAKPSDPAVAFVGWEELGRLVLPWDRDLDAARFRADIADPEFARKIEAAEAPGIDAVQAVPIYRAALDGARNPNQSAQARFLLARTLEAMGAKQEAWRHYAALLSQPTSVVDDQGMPFAYYAAAQLLGARQAQQDIIRRLTADLETATSRTPLQASFLKGIFEKLPKPKDGKYETLLGHIATIDQAIALQQEFESLRLTPTSWASYGSNEHWLVGASDSRPQNRRLIVAVRGKDIIRAVEAEPPTGALGVRIVAAGETGEPLTASLPGLHVSFSAKQDAETPAGSGLQSFYLLSLVLVLGLTVVGGYLVWRDTRRELRTADLRSQFVSNVSHELKTPLTSIRMFAEALQMRGLADERKQNEYLDTIVNESERLTRLLNNVLDFAPIERGQKSRRNQDRALSCPSVC